MDIDAAYQWLRFFLEDDEELDVIGAGGSGQGPYWNTAAVAARPSSSRGARARAQGPATSTVPDARLMAVRRPAPRRKHGNGHKSD